MVKETMVLITISIFPSKFLLLGSSTFKKTVKICALLVNLLTIIATLNSYLVTCVLGPRLTPE